MKRMSILIAALAAFGALTVAKMSAGPVLAQTKSGGKVGQHQQGASAQNHKEDDEKNDGQEDEMITAPVNMGQAVSAATQRVPGYANSAELESDNGKLIWSVDIVENGGRTKKEVEVDGNTGDVLKISDDNDEGDQGDGDGDHGDGDGEQDDDGGR